MADLSHDLSAAAKAPSAADDEALRVKIQALLAGGLVVEAFPRADTHEEVLAITARLQGVHDLSQKLAIAGFTLTPVEHGGIEQACETCMYYLVHRRFCELPELDLPVQPEWSCRLWRI